MSCRNPQFLLGEKEGGDVTMCVNQKSLGHAVEFRGCSFQRHAVDSRPPKADLCGSGVPSLDPPRYRAMWQDFTVKNTNNGTTDVFTRVYASEYSS